jgi:hypothetical protein
MRVLSPQPDLTNSIVIKALTIARPKASRVSAAIAAAAKDALQAARAARMAIKNKALNDEQRLAELRCARLGIEAVVRKVEHQRMLRNT